MNKSRSTVAAAIVGVGLLATGVANGATTYSYDGVVTLCTGTCDSFASLAIGSTLTGSIDIATMANGSFSDADVGEFLFDVFNDDAPPSQTGDPSTDNPLVLSSTLGVAASNGSAGTTDADNELNGGELLLEFLVPPFSSNGAFVVFDLATGNGQVCLFYATLGCLPGATEAVKFEGSFSAVPVPAAAWLFGSALFGLLGLRRRAA